MENTFSKEDISFILNLSKEMKTQDNRCTANPYAFVIGQKRRQSIGYENASDFMIYWNEDTYDTTREFINSLSKHYSSDHDIFKVIDNMDSLSFDDFKDNEYEINQLLEDSMSVIGYETIEDYSSNLYGGNFFLTGKSAEQYIKTNSHNLTKPFTYGIHLYKNQEMEDLYSIIHKLADMLETKNIN